MISSTLETSYEWNHAVFGLFYIWLISLNIMPSKFIHVVAYVGISYFFKSRIIFHGMCIPHFVYSSVIEHLGCFYLLAVVNNATVNMGRP